MTTFDPFTIVKHYVESVPEESTLPPMKSAVKARLVTIMTELPKPGNKRNTDHIKPNIKLLHLLHWPHFRLNLTVEYSKQNA